MRTSLVLLVLGILVTLAGVALVGFGISISDLTTPNNLVLAGTIGLVGGLLLVALSALVAELRRTAEALLGRQPGLAVQPPVRPARPAEASAPSAETVARDYPAAAPQPEVATPVTVPAPVAPAVEVSASAIERLRTSIPRADKISETEEVPLSPNGQQVVNGQHSHHAPQAQPIEPPPPMLEPLPRTPAAATAEAVREPRLDFLFRQRPARAAPQAEFDAMWPKRANPDAQPDPHSEVSRAPSAEAPPAEPPRTVAILKSGVVDGMAYTLYADGSIEAQLPQGTVRFGSIAELRAHIEHQAAR